MNSGTLMELGISPIVTSSMIMQLLSGLKLVVFDSSVKEERQLYENVQKLFGIVLTIASAVGLSCPCPYSCPASCPPFALSRHFGSAFSAAACRAQDYIVSRCRRDCCAGSPCMPL